MALTDEQLKALGLDMPPPDPTMAPGPTPSAILPTVQPAAPQSSLGAKILPDAQIPKSEMSAAYKAGGVSPADSYEAAMPKIAPEPTAPLGTYDWQKQRGEQIASKIEQMDFKKAHPWGSPESTHPGVLGKILHGLATAGNIAGDIVAPDVMANIPGTQMHNDIVHGNLEKELQQNQNAARQDVEQDQTNEIKRGKQDAADEKNKNDLSEKYRKLGLKLDATGNPVPVPYEELTPTEQAAHDLKTNQAEAADARAQLDRLKADPTSELYKMQEKRLEVAMQNSKNAAQRLGLSQEQFANKVREQDLLKPSGQAQSRGSAAQAALEVLPDLQAQIRSNAKELGPIFGRIQRGEIKIGDVDPKIQRLYSTMQSFYAMQPAVHGFRNAEFVKDFDSFVGGLQTNPEATLAGLDGLKPTLESVAKEGKTFHKRIVEGEGGGGESKAGFSVKAPNGKTYSFKDQASLDQFKKTAGIQ